MKAKYSLSSAQVLLDLCVDYLKAVVAYNEGDTSVGQQLEVEDCGRGIQSFLAAELGSAGVEFDGTEEEGLDDEDWG